MRVGMTPDADRNAQSCVEEDIGKTATPKDTLVTPFNGPCKCGIELAYRVTVMTY